MSKEKFSILGPNGEEVGFAIISLPQAEAPAFQQVANQALLDGPIADVALLFGSLAGFTSFAWLAFGPGWEAPATGLTITAVLAGIKAWRGGWPLPSELPSPAETDNNITITLTDQDSDTVYIDYFYDKTVELGKVAELAKLIAANDLAWLGRPTVCRETSLSQTDYNKIRAEFIKQSYLLELDNNHSRLTRRGRAVIRELSARLPHSTPSLLKRPLLGGTVTTNNKQQGEFGGRA
jgi:hypothetical protein